MTTSDVPEPDVSTLGLQVKSARKRLGLSVQALSERSGVSLGLISQVERGLGNPSFSSLQRIAQALGVPLAHLLDHATDGAVVVRADRRHVLPEDPARPPASRARRELLTPRGESILQLIRTTLPVGFSNEEHPFRHLGTETVTVERGVLEVVHGDQRMLLHAGDTATYACSTSHWWANGGDEPAVVLGAVTPFER